QCLGRHPTVTPQQSFRHTTPLAIAPPGPTDEELVVSARAGARPAFEALVRRYQEPVYFLCYRYVRDHDTAAELSQRAFVRALDSIRDLRHADILRGWLYK